MTDTPILLSDVEQTRRTIIRSVISGEISPADAAATLEISVSWFRVLRQRFERLGDAGIVDRRSSGCSRRTPIEVKDAVIELVRALYLGHSCSAIKRELAEKHAIDVANYTLRRWLVAEGLIEVRSRKTADRQHELSSAGRRKLHFRYRALRLRTWLAQVSVPQPSGPSRALMGALNNLAQAAAALIHQAKYELSAHDFMTAFDRSGMSYQEFEHRFPSIQQVRRYHS